MTREQYEAIDAVNFSTLKEFARSPAHYKAALQSPRESTDAMDLGSAFHLLALEPEREGELLAVWDEGTRRGKAWDAFKEKHAGKLLLTRDAYETAKAMAASVRSSPQAKPYLHGGQAEVTLQWEEQGLKCKGRVDYLTPTHLVDLKGTRCGAVEAFGKQMYDAKTAAQVAFYRSGIAQMRPKEPFRDAALIATENVFPYVTQVYTLTLAQLEQGSADYTAWLLTLKHCRETNNWPGYWPTETELVFPKWATQAEEYA